MGDISAEPSMEDILSSIKRIIAEEGDAGGNARGRRAPRSVPARERVGDASDVLELSDPVPAEDQATAAKPAEPAAIPASAEAILSEAAAQASRGALDTLSRMVVKPAHRGADTLEDLVREMLRPMLREWLDAKLPGLVETMVAREIARITQGR